MFVEELKGLVPEEIIDSAVKRSMRSLTPPQELAVRKGALSGKNVVVASPTASGKTFIAEMAMLRSVIWGKKKALYVAPMRAIVNEKYAEMSSAYPYIEIAISMGDLDSQDMWLGRYDIIFVSTEKLDSIIRHGAEWLGSLGCIVFDEIHMLGEAGRGPTLEILITKIKRLVPDAQIVALSATVGNADEIAEWLAAVPITSDYRPVRLEKGVVFEDRIFYGNKRENLLGKSAQPVRRIAEDTLERGKQLMIFYSSRRNAEAGAEDLSETAAMYLNSSEREALSSAAGKALGALGNPTGQCRKLAALLGKGVSFHHAGLLNIQRGIVENAFRSNALKIICSTTTLGLGVDMPAHTVVVRDVTRYGDNGRESLEVNEVTQLFGRAGRPRYDTSGRGLLIARSAYDIKRLSRTYMRSDPEPIHSVLGVLPVLRSHVLAFISSGFLTMESSILGFLEETFYGYEYGSGGLGSIVERILKELEEWSFVERRADAYSATKIGRRISELYIDPLSAKWILDSLPVADDDISRLFMISNTAEMRPYAKVSEATAERLAAYAHMIKDAYSSEIYERAFSTALVLYDWINEAGEAAINLKYRETPGSLFMRLNNADWLLYASAELARLMRMNASRLIELRVRVRYGIKAELLDLVSLEQIGRVRARMLFENGIKSRREMRSSDARIAAERLFGSEVAKRIYEQPALARHD